MKKKLALLLAGLSVVAASLAIAVSPAKAAGSSANPTPAAANGSSGGAVLTGPIPTVLPCPSCDGGGGGNINGSTHCFATWDHAGCQLNHSLSVTVVNYTLAGSLSAAGAVVCEVVTDGLASIGCAWIAGAIFYGVQGHISAMPYGECLEVGAYYWGSPYAERISCTVE